MLELMTKTDRQTFSRPRAALRPGVWLTAVIVLFNLLAPVLHTTAFAASGGERVQICTPSGITTIVLAADGGSVGPELDEHGGGCPLCPSCPLCLGPVSAALAPPVLPIGTAETPVRFVGWPRTAPTALTSLILDDASRPRAPPSRL
jgi:hypothetical protein